MEIKAFSIVVASGVASVHPIRRGAPPARLRAVRENGIVKTMKITEMRT